MVTYQFLITFVNGHKRLHVTMVDAKQWSLEQIVQTLKTDDVQSIDLISSEVAH